jgi:hypothetical protein
MYQSNLLFHAEETVKDEKCGLYVTCGFECLRLLGGF